MVPRPVGRRCAGGHWWVMLFALLPIVHGSPVNLIEDNVLGGMYFQDVAVDRNVGSSR